MKFIKKLKQYLGMSEPKKREFFPGETEKWREMAIAYYEVAQEVIKERDYALVQLESERAWREHYQALAEGKEKNYE